MDGDVQTTPNVSVRVIKPLEGKVSQVLERLQALILMQGLNDSLVLQLSNLSLATLFSGCPPNLQLVSINVVASIFKTSTRHQKKQQENVMQESTPMPSMANVQRYNSSTILNKLLYVILILKQRSGRGGRAATECLLDSSSTPE